MQYTLDEIIDEYIYAYKITGEQYLLEALIDILEDV